MSNLETGDTYIRRIASFIRTHESRLAEAGFQRRRPRKSANSPATPTAITALNPLSWFANGAPSSAPTGSRPKPLAFSIDTYHLFYLLIRLEAAGYDVGSLDVRVDSSSRPMSYVAVPGVDSDVLSMTSIRSSLSAVSRLSLGGSIWGRSPPPSVDEELRYIYSSFTKIPALSLHAPGPKQIAEIANDPPNANALPLDVFKNLQSLECIDIDPRTLIGWDRLADGLWSLTIKKSGLDDMSDLFIDCVQDDAARRAGERPVKRRRSTHGGPSRQPSFHKSDLPETIQEGAEDPATDQESMPGSPSSPALEEYALPATKWGFLRHLCLADNALTFFPAAPLTYLTSLTHLDLSSNLLVSAPDGLGALYNLTTLNLSDNMIDSVLGIYKRLGQVLSLNVAQNRLDSLCGLERLMALERVDVRGNLIEESAEVGRLAPLPHIAEIWIEGNPFTEFEDGYRVKVFDMFWREGKGITLDGSAAGFYERRNLSTAPPEQMSSSRPLPTAPSPPVVAVGSPLSVPVGSSVLSSSSSGTSPALVATKSRRRKPKRIVDLDGRQPDAPAHPAPLRPEAPISESPPDASPSPVPVLAARPKPLHRRSQTDAGLDAFAALPSDIATPVRSIARRKTRAGRASASVYESGPTVSQDEQKDAEAFRARIEALRSDVGEGWLKVFSQSQAVAGS